jgi:hypothetical protein
LELLDVPGGPSGVRLATGDKKLEVRLDEQRGEIVLTVSGGLGGGSSVRLSSSGITLDAGSTGEVKLTGGSVTINGTTGVTVNGGVEAVLKADLIRIN